MEVLVLIEQMVVQAEVLLPLVVVEEERVIHPLQVHLKEMMVLQKHPLLQVLTTVVVEVALEALDPLLESVVQVHQIILQDQHYFMLVVVAVLLEV